MYPKVHFRKHRGERSGRGNGKQHFRRAGEAARFPVADGETDAEEKDSSLKNYEALYQDMLEVTEKPKRALNNYSHRHYRIRWIILTRTMKTSSRFPVWIVADNGQDLFILTEYRIVENVERIQ